MEQWVDERNFADDGLFISDVHTPIPVPAATAAHDPPTSSGSSADAVTTPVRSQSATARERASSVVSPQWPLATATPTPPTPTPAASMTPLHELHAAASGSLAPSFETYVGVPPAFIVQFVRSRSEAALLYEVTGVALEMDVLMESVRDQLHDRRRVSDWLLRSRAERGGGKKASVMAMDTALLALQQQAFGVNERNLLLLLERFRACLQKLFDLQFPLVQCIESNEVAADELEDLGNLDAAAQRRKLLEVQVALLERLQALDREDSIPLASKLVSAAQLRQHQHGVVTSVCWPAASNSEESKRSTMDDVRLSSSSGSMASLFSVSSDVDEERRRRRSLEDAEDLNRTLTDHHEFPHDDDDDVDERGQAQPEIAVENESGGDKQQPSSQANNHSGSSPHAQGAVDGEGEELAGNHPSDHALSESVY